MTLGVCVFRARFSHDSALLYYASPHGMGEGYYVCFDKGGKAETVVGSFSPLLARERERESRAYYTSVGVIKSRALNRAFTLYGLFTEARK